MGIELLKNASTPKSDYDPVKNPNSLYYFNALTSISVMEAFRLFLMKLKLRLKPIWVTILLFFLPWVNLLPRRKTF